MASFDEMLANATSYADSYTDNLDIVSDKKRSLFESTLEKQKRLFGQSKPVTIESIQDGDGFTPVGGSENRMEGFDSYETRHDELNRDPGFQKHLAREKQRYSRQFGKPVDEVTLEDTRTMAEKEKLNNLYNMVKAPGDAPWTPGPTRGYVNDPLQLGSAENPLNIQANVAQTGNVDKYNRPISNVLNPNTGEIVNDQMQTGYNALYFDGKRPDVPRIQAQNQSTLEKVMEKNRGFRIGEIVKGNIDLADRPILQNTDGSISTEKSMSFNAEDGYETIIPTIINGKEVSEKEAVAHYNKTGEHMGKYNSVNAAEEAAQTIHKESNLRAIRQKDPKTLTQDEIDTLKVENLSGIDSDSIRGNTYWSQVGDQAQSSFTAKLAGIADSALDVVSGGNTNVRLPFLDRGLETYKDRDFMDKEFGVEIARRDKDEAETKAAFDKFEKNPLSFKNTYEYIKQGLYSTPGVFAASAGEIATYIHPIGWGAAILDRVNTDAQEFARNNDGQKMSVEQGAISTATNTAAYVYDMFIARFGIGKAIKGLGPANKSIKKRITDGMLDIILASGAEGMQEYIDQVQQIYNTEKISSESAMDKLARIGTSSEAIYGATMGVIAGGGAAGAAHIGTGVKAAPRHINRGYDRVSSELGLRNAGKNLDAIDREFSAVDMENENAIDQAGIEELAVAKSEIDKASSIGGSGLEALKSSTNERVQGIYKQAKAYVVAKNSNKINDADNTTIKNTIDEDIGSVMAGSDKELKAQMKALGYSEDVEQNKVTTEKLLKTDAGKASLYSLMSQTDTTSGNNITSFIDPKEFTGKDIKSILKKGNRVLDDARRGYEQSISNRQKVNKKLTRTKAKTRLGEKPDLGAINKSAGSNDVSSLKNAIKTVFGSGKVKENIDKALDVYSDKALNSVLEEADPRTTKAIKKILSRREKAKKFSKIDISEGSNDPLSPDYKGMTKDVKATNDKTKNINAIKGFLRRNMLKNMSEVAETSRFIAEMKDKGHINPVQEKILRNRLKRIADRTEKAKIEEVKKSKTAESAINKEAGSEKKQATGDGKYGKGQYSASGAFEGMESTREEHVGDIVGTHEDTDRIVVEFDTGLEPVRVTFKMSSGEQVMRELDDLLIWSDGKPITKTEVEEEAAAPVDSGALEGLGETNFDGEMNDEDANAAIEKANNDTLNDMLNNSDKEIEAMTDAQFEKRLDELEKLMC